MNEISLRKKFLTYTAMAAMAIMVVSAVFVEISYRNSLIASAKDKLELHIFNLLAVTEFNSQGVSLPTVLSNPQFNEDDQNLWALVLDKNQTLLWQSLSIESPPSNLPLSRKVGEWRHSHIEIQDRSYHSVSYAIAWQDQKQTKTYHFVVASDASLLSNAISQFRLRLLFGFIAITITLLAVQSWVLNRVFSPIKKLESEITQLENGEQNQLHGQYPLELSGVTHNLNALIEKEHQQREKYRASMADLAHSLKTPVAIIKSEISGYADNPTLNHAIHRINDTIEYQLRRAVISGHTLVSSGTQISDTANMVLNALQKIYQHKDIRIVTDVSDDALFKGDENDLMEIFGNLLDNAFKHAREKINITATLKKRQLDIIIEDDGSGIPDDQADDIFSRGKRLDEAQNGQGIGLAIVHDIVDSYRGVIQLNRSQLGGARFHIRFIQEI